MSTTRRQPVLFAIATMLGLAGFIWAQPADPLEQKRLENEIQAQKLLREVSTNIQEARQLSVTNPQKARDILRSTKALLEDDVISLPERQRKDLLSQVELKLRDINGKVIAQKTADDILAAKAAEAERLKIKLAADDRKAYGTGVTPSMVLDGKFKAMENQKKMQIAMAEQYKKRMQDQYYGQVEKGSPKYKEIEIMKMLNSTMSVDFKGDDSTLKKALDYIDDKTEGKLNMLLDDTSLKDAGVDPNEKQVTLKMKKFRVRTIMKALLEPNGLDYYLEDGTLRICDKKKAQDQLIVKMYPIKSLIAPQTGMMNPMMSMMMGNQAKQNAQALAMLMMNSIEPKYWKMTTDGAGPGEVDWEPRSMSLVIKASLEVHYMLKASDILNPYRSPNQPPLQ